MVLYLFLNLEGDVPELLEEVVNCRFDILSALKPELLVKPSPK